MTDRTSRWPTVTGLWLGLATWLYAALAAYEVWETARGGSTPDSADLVPPTGLADALVDPAAAVLGVALLGSLGSLVTGRARRPADLLLAVGLGFGAATLWAGEDPRPVTPVVVGAAAIVAGLSAMLPERPAEGRLAGFLARLLLATVALLLGWVCAHELADGSWRLRTWSLLTWAGLGVAALMLLASLLGPLLVRPVWRWLLGLPTLLVGLAATAGGCLGLAEGRLVTGSEEVEPGWWLGGPAVFLGAGLTAAGLALLRGRWTLAVGTVGACVLTTLGVVFGIPEMRSGF